MSVFTEYRMADFIPSFDEFEVRQLYDGRIVCKSTPNVVGDIVTLPCEGGSFAVMCRWDEGTTSFRRMTEEEMMHASEQGIPTGRWRHGKKVLIDIKGSKLTFSQVMDEIERYKRENPHMDVFMDGDLYAICSEPRRVRA